MIFRRYGEERYAKQIMRAIVRRRREQPFERTGELVDTIKASIPAPARFGDGHPAKRVFQALRIAVNDELDSLGVALPAALEMLRPGGRLAVISFHSLDDRIVKRFLASASAAARARPTSPSASAGTSPSSGRCSGGRSSGQAELAANPRAASARLRAAVKTGGGRLMAAVDWFAHAEVAEPVPPGGGGTEARARPATRRRPYARGAGQPPRPRSTSSG